MNLGAALASLFTVIIPDRRGRGMSGSYSLEHGINTECEDIRALLDGTSARNLFGLSAGAVVCLWAALTSSQIQNLALYEPPLPVEGTDPVSWLPRFDREIARGNLAEAMIAVMRGTTNSRMVAMVPRLLLAPLLNFAIEADAKKTRAGDVPLKEIIPTMHFDAKMVSDTKGSLERLRGIRADVLLLGGSRSPAYLKGALDALEKILPQVRRVEFPRMGHLGPDNRGKPEIVAQELRQHFKRNCLTSQGRAE
jgi:pimeloyl-ACP methyl ester carboxylesterase